MTKLSIQSMVGTDASGRVLLDIPLAESDGLTVVDYDDHTGRATVAVHLADLDDAPRCACCERATTALVWVEAGDDKGHVCATCAREIAEAA